uniref:Restriction alleviation protein n=1 Tax=Marseillevirus LCMAC201 TaxID=2506605 RepID=A0A481YWR5_9VIRU|nr:MAG: hypothetical protein LCMAC201_02410 [Marseillevirus LCMAC201]
MFSAIRPKNEEQLRDQPNCPICGSGYIDEYTVVPSVRINLAVEIYECANQHSWKKYPKSIPLESDTPSTLVEYRVPEPFRDVYRPLHDTQELQKLR